MSTIGFALAKSRVIDEEGGQLGVMQPFEALKMARERGLDLVEISPTADPPVCKITDYGKFLYQQSKKAHEQRKSSRGSALKEVKFRPATAEHDFQVRKNQIIRFLGEGHKVRAMIFHRGREMAHQEVGRAKMTRLLGEIGDAGAIETPPRMEGNVLVALLAPKRARERLLRAGRIDRRRFFRGRRIFRHKTGTIVPIATENKELAGTSAQLELKKTRGFTQCHATDRNRS